ncbi:MAG: CDP-glycerol glycerophosphotransferase family protein [Eubacterium sp.]|nr:CDP-glycerol glycerophosphotransferase family protein [Eubacterium sp.]
MAKDFKISVIMPIYNVEDYLAEALDSVLHQSLDFEKNVQLVLINDGSHDGSEAICQEYQRRYPDNITYVYKENGGVSSARNMGIDYAKGKYITFLDPDDKWDESSFKHAYSYFEKHYDEIDVLAARVRFFEAVDKFHILDYKFKEGTRLVDIDSEEERFTIQSTIATAFVKREAIGELRFDTQLKFGEDSTFVNKLILKKRRYGLMKEALYYYRRRAAGGSAVNTQRRQKAFYIDSLERYHLELFRYSRELYGEVIPYIRAVVGYDISWRFASDEQNFVLTEQELQEYYDRMHTILSEIDDVILLTSPTHTSIEKKYDAMYYKHGINLYEHLRFDTESGCFMYNDISILNLSYNKTNCLMVTRCEIEGSRLILEILIAQWFFKCTETGAELVLKFNDKEIKPTLSDYPISKFQSREGEKLYYYSTKVTYDFSEELKHKGDRLIVVPYLRMGDVDGSISLNYGKFIAATTRFGAAYKFFGDYGVKCWRTSIRVYYPTDLKSFKAKWDMRSLATLIKRKQLYAFKQRYIEFPRFQKKQEGKGSIWLVSDRIDNAGDNGEVFFKYLCEHCPEGVRPIFMIGRVAKDEVKQRLESIGEVVYAEDKDYPYYFLCADKVISSGAGEFTINPFGNDRRFFVDLFHFKYYYLQHGVACADLSAWLNRNNKNIYMFFTAGERERRSIIDGNYLYTEKNVVLTGQARFDALYNDNKKQVLILPTWRRSISQAYDEKTSSVYFDGFKDTDYFKFYNGLINNERLLAAMRDKGYSGLFCLHPIFMKQSVDFEQNDVFRVNEGYIDYNKTFAESSVMVTDYSSVLFDFAYLRKPVVYTHFDKQEFFETQIYDEGYFSYENDGFGPVCYDMDSTVDAIIELVNHDCQNPEQYVKRVDDFFAFNDNNNAKRILEAIIEDDKKQAK